MFVVNGNIFVVNGNMFVINGKPFINKSHISCGFLKYAWWAFLEQLTPVRNNITYYHHIKINY